MKKMADEAKSNETQKSKTGKAQSKYMCKKFKQIYGEVNLPLVVL